MLFEKSFIILICNNLKNSVLFFTLVFANAHLFSQTKKIDSLKLVLQTAKHDTTRIEALNKWANLLLSNNPNEAIQLFTKSQLLAEKNIALNPAKITEETVILLDKNKDQPEGKRSFIKYIFFRKLGSANSGLGNAFYYKGQSDSAFKYHNKSLQVFILLKYEKGIAAAYSNLGLTNLNIGKIDEAFYFFKQSLKINKALDNKIGIAYSLHNIANIYNRQGQIKEALNYYTQSLKIKENLGDKLAAANTLNNIANIYTEQDQVEEALNYFNRSLKIRKEINDKKGTALCYNNIGIIFRKQLKLNEALDYYLISLNISKEIDDKYLTATLLGNIGNIYFDQKKLEKALDYSMQNLILAEKIKDKLGIATACHNIANAYLFKEKLNDAIKYGSKSLQISNELGNPKRIKEAADILKTVFQKQNNPTKALEMFELSIKMRDSINNDNNRNASYKSKLQYDYAKKTLADSIKLADEKKITFAKLAENRAKLKQEKTQKIVLYIIAGFLILFAGILFYNYRRKNQSNKLLEFQKIQIEQKNQQLELQKNNISTQKRLLEIKNNQITDSIEYAEKIQGTMLPNTDVLKNYFTEAFIYYQPKDIVSGDFYWLKELEQSTIAIAAADCTGHGVPGALMSVLGHNGLDSAYAQLTNTQPTEVVKHLDTYFKQKTSAKNNITTNVDGMALSLINYNKQAQLITYTTANHSIYFVRDNQLTELKSNNFSIGSLQNQDINHGTLQVQKNDMVYLFTDGYADQKGGPQNRKYMTKKLKETFIKIANLAATDQQYILKTEMDTWKGTNNQVDDMLILGVRI